MYILIFDKYNKFYSSIYYAPFFIFGIMTFKNSINKSKFNFIGMYLCLILSIIFYYVYNLKGASSNGGQWDYNNGLPLNVICSTLIFIGMVTLFLRLCNTKPLKKYKFIDVALGEITYSMYLIHVPIIALFDVFLDVHNFTGYILIVLSTITVSVLIHIFYEKFFTKIRSKIRGYTIN